MQLTIQPNYHINQIKFSKNNYSNNVKPSFKGDKDSFDYTKKLNEKQKIDESSADKACEFICIFFLLNCC